MKNYKWTIKSISRWNKETFPDETTKGQRIKCMKEAKEYFYAETYKERIGELADFFIANAGLGGRFGDESGLLVCDIMKELRNWYEINEAVQEKMEINLTRKWKKIKGENRHVTEKENDEQQAIVTTEAESFGDSDHR